MKPHLDTRIHVIYTILAHALMCTTYAQDPDSVIHFQVTEQVADIFFGSVKASEYIRNLFDASQRRELRFALAPSPDQDASLFYIDPDTGNMETAVAIDREEHCPSLVLCFIYIQVSTIAPRFEVS